MDDMNDKKWTYNILAPNILYEKNVGNTQVYAYHGYQDLDFFPKVPNMFKLSLLAVYI